VSSHFEPDILEVSIYVNYPIIYMRSLNLQMICFIDW